MLGNIFSRRRIVVVVVEMEEWCWGYRFVVRVRGISTPI